MCVCVLCAAWQPRLEVQPGEECVCMSVCFLLVCERVCVCVCVCALCAAWQPRLEVQPGRGVCVYECVFSVSL